MRDFLHWHSAGKQDYCFLLTRRQLVQRQLRLEIYPGRALRQSSGNVRLRAEISDEFTPLIKYWSDRDAVQKWLTAFPVVLNLHYRRSLVADRSAKGSGLQSGLARARKKAAVSANHLGSRIASEIQKSLIARKNWKIWKRRISDNAGDAGPHHPIPDLSHVAQSPS